MPDDRLSDATIRHDALLSAAGSLSVHAGVLTIIYTGSGPHDLLHLLAGASGGDGGVLRLLRLSARVLRFEAVPVKADAGDEEGQQQQQQHEAAGPQSQQQQEQAEAAAGSTGAAAAGGAAGGAQQPPGRHQAGAEAAAPAPAAAAAAGGGGGQRLHSCSGAELRDLIAGSEWAAVWEAKLQRSMFRDQETLVLTRKEPASPVPAMRLQAASMPATR